MRNAFRRASWSRSFVTFACAVTVVFGMGQTGRAQCDQTVFGFQKYQRTSNGTETFRDFFPVSDPSRNYALVVYNGLNGQSRISRGSIRVNGVEVAAPSHFSQQVDAFENPIGALLPNNQLDVTLQRGDAGGFIVVRIVDRGAGITSISGTVHSTTDQPLEKVQLTTERVSAVTDRDGNFRLDNVPCGRRKIQVDASGIKGKKTYASVNLVLFLDEGVDNHLDRPIFLPEIDLSNAVAVPALVTEDIIVSNPDLPGVSLRIKSGTVVAYPGGASSQLVSITEVPLDRTPRGLPAELAPTLVITVQPESAVLSRPAEITYPNTENLPPGSQVDLMSLSPGSGGFVSTGLGTVDPTGTSIVADPTSGLSAFDWHFWAPPPGDFDFPDGDRGECPCERSVGSEADLAQGGLSTRHTLAGHVSLGGSRELTLSYNSLNAYPRPILGVASTFDSTIARPLLYSYQLLVEGAVQGSELFTDTSFLSLGAPEKLWQALQFDASALPTGLYEFEIRPTGFFNDAVRTYSVAGVTSITNDSLSPFGAGWGLAGLESLHLQPDGEVLIIGGDGSRSVFRPVGEGPVYDLAWLTGDPLAAAAVRLGNPGGGFQPPALFEGDSRQEPNTMLTADFNLDLVPDLMLFSDPETVSGELVVLLGDNGGTLRPPLRSGQLFPEDVVNGRAADFNGDSIPDLAVVNDSNPQQLAVLLGNGDGTFRNLSRDPLEGFNLVAALGDFNGDGNIDLVLQNGLDAGVRLGNGDGTFQSSIPTGIGCFLGGLVAADFNGDSRLDLAVVDGDLSPPFEPQDEVCVALGNGDGSFGPSFRQFVGSGARRVLAADFDGDSSVDLATVNFRTVDISFLRGNGDGTFQPSISTGLPEPPNVAETVDYDSDSLPDIVVSGNTTASVMRARGDGRFDLFDQAEHNGGTSVLILNLNTDARAQGYLSPAGDNSSLAINPDGTFTRRLADGTGIHFDLDGRHTATIDRNGNSTIYTYNPDGTPAAITDPAGLTTSFEYVGGRLSRIVDSTGRATTFTFNASGELIQIVNPDGSAVQFEYNDSNTPHLLTAQIDGNGGRVDYEYDLAGRFVRSVAQAGPAPVTRMLLPAAVVSLVDPTGGLGSFANPAPATFLDEIRAVFTDGNGNDTVYRFDDFGNPLEITDALGRVTRFERDVDGNATRFTRADGVVTTFSYDQRGNLVSWTNQDLGATTTMTYHPEFNEVASIEDPNGQVTTFDYDANGNLIQVVRPTGATSSATFSPEGLMTTATNPLGNSMVFAYDALGRLSEVTDALGNSTILTRDAAGNVSSFTDPEGVQTLLEHDSMNRLRQVLDGSGSITAYEYDGNGNLATLTDANGNVTSFEYDAQNQPARTINPLGEASSFAYDGVGNLTSVTDANGGVTLFEYDAANRLTRKTLPDGSISLYTYDAADNLVAAEDSDSALTIGYDAADRIVSESTLGSPSQPDVSVQSTYDAVGNRLSMVNSVTGSTAYAYDLLYRPASLTLPSGEVILLTHDAFGLRTQNSLPNGTVTDFLYNANASLTEIHHQADGAASSFVYGLGAAGYRISQSVLRPVGGLNGNLVYDYDDLYQLTQATHPVAGQPDETFIYDAVGNRIRRDGDPADAVFDAANRLLEDVSFFYTHDRHGNLVEKRDKATGVVTQFAYDGDNQLTQVQAPGLLVTYRYDAVGRRIEKNVNGVVVRYVYDREDILLEFDGDDVLQAEFTHGPGVDEPLAMRRLGDPHFYHADGLGSITELTDAAGSVVQSYVYDAFGNIVGTTAPLDSPANPYAYAGREFDPETGLYYYRARYYDPATGRFQSEDPLAFVDGTANLYAYPLNNPLNLTDPTGEHGVFVIVVAGVLLVVFVGEAVVLPVYCGLNPHHCHIAEHPPHTHEEHPMMPPNPMRDPCPLTTPDDRRRDDNPNRRPLPPRRPFLPIRIPPRR